MPYIVACDVEVCAANTATMVYSPPQEAQAGDLLVLMCCVPSTASGIGTPAGWTAIGTQVNASQQRSYAIWKIAAASEPAISISSPSAQSQGVWFVIRGHNAASPIGPFSRNDIATPVVEPSTSPVTTTEDGSLVLIFHSGNTTVNNLVAKDQSDYVNLVNSRSGGLAIAGYTVLPEAGTLSSIPFLSEYDTAGGAFWAVSIRDADPDNPQLPPLHKGDFFEWVSIYGGAIPYTATVRAMVRYNPDVTVAADILTPASLLTPTSIDGLLINTDAAFNAGTMSGTGPGMLQQTPFSFTHANRAVAGVVPIRWYGYGHEVAAPADISDGILFVSFLTRGLGWKFATRDPGAALVFEDSSGEWVAYRLMRRAEGTPWFAADAIGNAPSMRVLFDSSALVLDESGDIDFADITKIAWLRATTTATGTDNFSPRVIAKFRPPVMVGGCLAAPVKAVMLVRAIGTEPLALDSGQMPMAACQTNDTRQFVETPVGVTFGDGSTPTVVWLDGDSIHLAKQSTRNGSPRAVAAFSEFNQYRAIRINASPDDVMSFAGSSIYTIEGQDLVIDPASSPDAEYDFSAAQISGFRVTNDVEGVVINGATFDRLRGMSLLGGGLERCIIRNATDPIVTDDPGNIAGCVFYAGGGHAIEITSIGTYEFLRNAFVGYGDDDTANAAIYNNSGGLVVLQIVSAEDQPTVLDEAGSTTEFEILSGSGSCPDPVLTVDVIAGSRVQLYNVTQNAEIENVVEATTQYVFAFDLTTPEADVGDVLRIRVTRIGRDPEELVVRHTDGEVHLVANQPVDAAYAFHGVDGSTVTEFDEDYATPLIELNTAVDFRVSRMYAWYSALLETEDGIREWFGAITPIDEFNFLIRSSVADIYIDNTTATNVIQPEVVRIFRDDDDYPVLEPTSGGGGIDVVWREPVFRPPSAPVDFQPVLDALEVINGNVKKASLLIPASDDI